MVLGLSLQVSWLCLLLFSSGACFPATKGDYRYPYTITWGSGEKPAPGSSLQYESSHPPLVSLVHEPSANDLQPQTGLQQTSPPTGKQSPSSLEAPSVATVFSPSYEPNRFIVSYDPSSNKPSSAPEVPPQSAGYVSPPVGILPPAATGNKTPAGTSGNSNMGPKTLDFGDGRGPHAAAPADYNFDGPVPYVYAPAAHDFSEAQAPYAEAPAVSAYGDAEAQAPYAEAPAVYAYGDAQAPYAEAPAVYAYGDAEAQAPYAEAPAVYAYGEAQAPDAYGDAEAQAPAVYDYAEAQAPAVYDYAEAQAPYAQAPAVYDYAEAQVPDAEAQAPAVYAYGDAQAPDAEAQAPYAEAPAVYAYGDAEAQAPYAEAPAVYAYGDAEAQAPYAEAQAPAVYDFGDAPHAEAPYGNPSSAGFLPWDEQPGGGAYDVWDSNEVIPQSVSEVSPLPPSSYIIQSRNGYQRAREVHSHTKYSPEYTEPPVFSSSAVKAPRKSPPLTRSKRGRKVQ